MIGSSRRVSLGRPREARRFISPIACNDVVGSTPQDSIGSQHAHELCCTDVGPYCCQRYWWISKTEGENMRMILVRRRRGLLVQGQQGPRCQTEKCRQWTPWKQAGGLTFYARPTRASIRLRAPMRLSGKGSGGDVGCSDPLGNQVTIPFRYPCVVLLISIQYMQIRRESTVVELGTSLSGARFSLSADYSWD